MSNKSKALCRKSLRKTHKMVKKLLRNQELYNKFAGCGNGVHEEYVQENICEKQLTKMWNDLDKFCESFKDAGGRPNSFREYIMTSFAFDLEIMKDINKRVK